MMTRNEICKAMRAELKEIRHKALSADRDAIRVKELQEQLAVNTRGQDYSRAASSVHTFRASAVEGQAVRREYIQRELDALQKKRAACLDAVEQYKAVVRRCCFYYMYDVLEARYFKGFQWRVVGAAVGMPESKARAIEEQALLLLALRLHGWRPGYMTQEELEGVGLDECRARYQDAVVHWAAVEHVVVERGRPLGKSLDRARAAVDCLASRLGIPAEQVRKDFERAYAGGGSRSGK
ncbi:hypothetical protein [Mitsuokella multacida]|uniref:hypothetical protein n=2 Tax=Mitsuokella multacida TaxID=52226 RepID=UPI00241FD461|nr:hypothetical protein [Mitsuokella multacida]